MLQQQTPFTSRQSPYTRQMQLRAAQQEAPQLTQADQENQSQKQLEVINSKIAEYQQKKEHYDRVYNLTSGEESYQADVERVRLQSYIDALEEAKAYTGNSYELQSILDYAMQRAERQNARITPRPPEEVLQQRQYQKTLPENVRNISNFRNLPEETQRDLYYGEAKKIELATMQNIIPAVSTPSKNIEPLKTMDVQGEIYQKPTGTFNEVPTYEIRYRQGDADRLATKEEYKDFIEKTNKLVMPEKPKGFFEKFEAKKSQFLYSHSYNDLSPNVKKMIRENIAGVSLGFAASFVDLAKSGKEFLTDPIQFVESLPESIKSTGEFVTSGKLAEAIRTEPEFLSGYAAGILTQGKLAGAAIKYGFGEKVTIKPLREPKVPEFIEKQITILDKGQEYRVAKYTIEGELSPPKVKITNTALKDDLSRIIPKQFAEDLNIAPEIEIIPAKEFTLKSDLAVNNQAFGVVEKIKGSKISKVSEITGESQPIDFMAQKPSEIDRFLLKQMIESETGKPISFESARSFYPKTDIFEIGDIESQILAKPKGKSLSLISNEFDREFIRKNLKLIQGKGKTTTTAKVLTRTRQLLENDYVEVLESKSFFKDVTQRGSYSRATGKTPRLKGTIFRIKEPIIFDEADTGVKMFKPSGSTKTRLSQTFTELEQIQTQLPKALPKVSKVKTRTFSKPITATSKTELASALVADNILELDAAKTDLRSIPSNINKEQSKAVAKEEYKTIDKLLNKSLNKSLEKNLSKSSLKEDSVLKNILVQKALEKQMQKEVAKEITKPSTRTPSLFPPLRATNVFGKFPRVEEKRKRRGTKRIGTYSLFVRQKKKYIPFGSGYTKSEALATGSDVIQKTLARTFKVKETGSRETFSMDISNFMPDERVFRTYKQKKGKRAYEPNLFIQRGKYSLSSPEERFLLQQARKSPRKKKNNMNLYGFKY